MFKCAYKADMTEQQINMEKNRQIDSKQIDRQIVAFSYTILKR